MPKTRKKGKVDAHNASDSVRKYGGLYSIAGLKEVLPCIETHSDIIVTEKKLSALKGARLFYPRQRCVK